MSQKLFLNISRNSIRKLIQKSLHISPIIHKPLLFNIKLLTRCLYAQSILQPTRYFWAWLNVIWNRYDKERVKEIGSDMAAAEWLLRCGAMVRFKEHPDWLADYNSLQNDANHPKLVEAIDTNESCVDAMGFDHLQGLTHLKRLDLRFSPYVTDACLKKIATYVSDTLEELNIQDCYEISEWGLMNYLPPLKKLKSLTIKNIPLIKDNPTVFKAKLTEILPPDCNITIK